MAFNPDAKPFDPSIQRMVEGNLKNLTCHFWLRGQCRFNEDDCRYSHQLTGKIADMPIRLGYNAPAVAGASTRNQNPIYRHWRGQSALSNPEKRIQRQIAEIHAKETARRQDQDKDVLKDNIIRGQSSVINVGLDTLMKINVEEKLK